MKYNFKKLIFAQLVSLAFIVMQSNLICAEEPVTKSSKKKGDEAKQKEILMMAGIAVAFVAVAGVFTYTIIKHKDDEEKIKILEEKNSALAGTTQAIVNRQTKLNERIETSDANAKQRSDVISGKVTESNDTVKSLKKKVSHLGEGMADTLAITDSVATDVGQIKAGLVLPYDMPIFDAERVAARQVALSREARDRVEGGAQFQPTGSLISYAGPYQTVAGESRSLLEVMRNQAMLATSGYHLGFCPISTDNPIEPPDPVAAHH